MAYFCGGGVAKIFEIVYTIIRYIRKGNAEMAQYNVKTQVEETAKLRDQNAKEILDFTEANNAEVA